MSDSQKIRFTASNKEVKPLLPKKSPVPKLNMESTNPLLEDLVQCSLCANKFKEPKMLICQHTFCLNCLQYNLPSGASVVVCSICNEITDLQNGFESLEHLPGNMYIDSLLKVLSNAPNTPNININTNMKHCSECPSVCQFSEHTYNNSKQDLHTLIDQLNDYDERLNHKIDTFQDRCNKIKESIRQTTEIKIKAVKQQEINCLNEISEIRKNECALLYDIKTRINDIKTTMNESNFDVFNQNALRIFEDVARLPENKRFYFDGVNFKIERDDLEDCDNDVETEDELSQNTSIIANPLESHDTLIEHYKYRRFTSKFTWTKCARPAHIAIAPWNSNCIYIAATDNRNIYMLDKQKFKLMGRLNDPNMLCPVGLTFSSDQLFVTDKWKHCIHVFSKQGNLITTFGKKGSAPGQFRSPEGLAYHSNRLFICDTGNDRIQVINATSGAHMYSFGITGAGKALTEAGFVLDFKYTELNMPTGIAIADNRVIVVDSGNKRVKIYSLEGCKLMEFGSLGKSKGQFRSPEVVAVDPLGFIFVGDSGNARVQVFRPNGTLVRVFGSKGNLAWVSGVCVTPQLEVIVSDYKSHTVHIF